MAVRTKSGLVTGLVEDGIEVFKGIPYGAPTDLSGRFRPPALPEAWSGERACRTVGFACPQPELALAGLEERRSGNRAAKIVWSSTCSPPAPTAPAAR
jgi:para-nitrobenzyl esterase